MGKSAITFKGGRSDRYSERDATVTGMRPYTPRWSPPAAAAALRVLHSMASAHEKHPVPFFQQAVESTTTWETLMRRMRRQLTQIQFENATQVLAEDRAAILALAPSDRPLKAQYALRACRRRAAECPQLPSLEIPEAARVEPPSFLELIESAPKVPVRDTPPASQQEGPLEYARLWGLHRVEHDGAVVFARAGGRVREWRKKHGAARSAVIEIELARSLVHRDILPTLTANKQDQPWLTGPQRYMSVYEVCRCMGLTDTSPLTKTLACMPHPANAVRLLGKAIHAGVAALILDKLESEGLLPVHLQYASACSGIDTFAAALDVIRPGGLWTYRHAAERDKEPCAGRARCTRCAHVACRGRAATVWNGWPYAHGVEPLPGSCGDRPPASVACVDVLVRMR